MPLQIGLYKQTLGAYFDANILYNHCEDILVELLGKGVRHPLLLRTAFAASTNFRGPGYYEDAAVKLNVAFTMASELYDADSVPVAKAIYSRALLMRDLGDLTEASRLLPQVQLLIHISPSPIYPFSFIYIPFLIQIPLIIYISPYLLYHPTAFPPFFFSLVPSQYSL